MNLNEFLNEKTFKKIYSKDIINIKQDFIESGYEKYLWRSHREIEGSIKETKKLLESHKQFEYSELFINFLEQFEPIKQPGMVAYVFPDNPTDNSLILKEYCKSAYISKIIRNIFPEDENTSRLAVFYEPEVETKIFMNNFVFQSSKLGTADYGTWGGIKLFGCNISHIINMLCYNNVVLHPETNRMYSRFMGNNYRTDTNPFLIYDTRKSIEMMIRKGYLNNELELYRNIYELLFPFFKDHMNNQGVLMGREAYSARIKQANETKNRIRDELILEGKINGKWKSEQSLFQIAKKLYPDAMYQYRPLWLEPQSLDIYIPSINLAIEYQGVQHYKSVDFFGGEDAFLHRQELDRIKKQKCKNNNIKLLDWSYKEPINIERFKNNIDNNITA